MKYCCLLIAGALVAQPLIAEEGFVPLFDGKSLDGWVQRGGKASYSVVIKSGAVMPVTKI